MVKKKGERDVGEKAYTGERIMGIGEKAYAQGRMIKKTKGHGKRT